jgi:thiamine biosynthesis lipoprotein
MAMIEIEERFECFGSTCAVLLFAHESERRAARRAAHSARAQLLAWHHRFSRFEPTSELSRLNADPREEVPVSAAMAGLADAAVRAAYVTGGLVDATLLTEVERAGYRSDLSTSLPLEVALRYAPPRRAAGPSPRTPWRQLSVDLSKGTVRRPPGLMLDSGGLAKGLFADLLSYKLRTYPGYVVDCGGDLRLGGSHSLEREVHVASPLERATLHTFSLSGGGAATSGIGRRSWIGSDGTPAHHLLDPATGEPAYTGLVQVTALAPTALEAEIRAKAALLAGPDEAPTWLAHGGVVVHDDGSAEVMDEPAAVLRRESAGGAAAAGL